MSFEYICESFRIRQTTPLSHGNYSHCSASCPNYPKATKRVRLTPYDEVQRDEGKGWKQRLSKVPSHRFGRCAVCGVTFEQNDPSSRQRETCGSKECVHKLIVKRRVEKYEQKKRDTIDISGYSEDELETCPVCGRLYRPVVKGQRTCRQGLCPRMRAVNWYHIRKAQGGMHDVEKS